MRTRQRLRPPLLLLPLLVAHACGSPPREAPQGLAIPADAPPQVDTGEAPSALQRHLAALTPVGLSTSKTTARLGDALDAFHARTPARRAYLAVDKPLYRPGETIWFRSFDLLAPDLSGPEGSYGTTFRLVSPKGAVVLEKRVLTAAGAAHNDFVLPADVPGGEYVLAAATDHGAATERSVIVASYEAPRIKKKLEFVRKAYGPGDTVAAGIALHRATGEALGGRAITGVVQLDGDELARVAVTTDEAGAATVRFDLPSRIARGDGLLTVLVEDGGVTESIQRRIPITLDRLQLSLYPEGGDLVAGLPGRVYLSARNALGDPADVAGRVVDDQDRVVARFRSLHDGLGRFEITPEARRRYHLELDEPAGIDQRFAVPEAVERGCSLQAVDDFASQRDHLRVAVWCSTSRPVVATATLRGERLATVAAEVEAGAPAVLALPTPAGKQGAVRVTVFDDALTPLAERLVYRHHGRDLEVTIESDRGSYNPRDEVTLTVRTRDADGAPVPADLALAVRDDTVLSFADDETAHIRARVYLEGEMPGQEIEEPDFYFSDDPIAPAALDLVLGTQGWRRFDWQPVLAPAAVATGAAGFAVGGVAERAEAAVEEDLAAAAPPQQQQQKPQPVARPVPPADQPLAEPAPMPVPPPALGVARVQGVAAGERVARDAGRLGAGFDIGDERRRARRPIRDKDWDGVAKQEAWAWAPVRQFPAPRYPRGYDGPRTDFRDTIYWNPKVVTGDDGTAQVSFHVSDAVTSFRATAEGVGAGLAGRGESLVQSKLPVSLALKLPVEVSKGDVLRLPVTVANETAFPYQATLSSSFGKAFTLRGKAPPRHLALAPGQRRSFLYELAVVGDGADPDAGRIQVAVEAANLRDEVERTLRVVPLGFPQEISVAGTVERRERHDIELTGVLPGTLHAELTMYPSPLSTMIEGTAAMLREPVGCFEQASSANYPNIMILGYLEEHGAADPELVERTRGMLDRGYQKLIGYESPERGYEWFGGDPGHEALTAYGLMEFLDMTRVYGDVDRTMIERTATWLEARRDGKGGYQRSAQALDSFGRASEEVTNAYITYALTKAGRGGLDTEIDRQLEASRTTGDPYLMALASNTLLAARPDSSGARAAVRRLAALQAEDGSFPGADHSITRSGGIALAIESTSLATLALLASGTEPERVRRAVEWLNGQRDGFGGYGSTQSTVLALEALQRYAAASRVTRAAGVARVVVNGEEVGRIAYEAGHEGALRFDLSDHLAGGANTVEVLLDSSEPLPYSMLVGYHSAEPASSPEAVVDLETRLARERVPMGEGVTMKVRVANRTDEGIPMALARVGLPGGLAFQTWQLEELRDKGRIDFYETREREVILYFRSMAPKADEELELELLAQVPGTYTAPASRAYLYYTDEHVQWVPPVEVTVSRK